MLVTNILKGSGACPSCQLAKDVAIHAVREASACQAPADRASAFVRLFAGGDMVRSAQEQITGTKIGRATG
jgi:hypothetical protein